MFNQDGFSDVGFNVPIDLFVDGQFFVKTTAFLEADGKIEFSAKLQAYTGTFAKIRITVPAKMTARSRAFGQVTGGIDLSGKFTAKVSSFFIARGRRLQIEAIEFTGAFAPSDVIEIDMDKEVVTLNGQNAFKNIKGKFLQLSPGENDFTFVDTQGERTVKITVSHRDRWN